MRDLALPDWMQAWVKMAAPDEPHKFQRRLDWDGWSTESFKAWLCSDPAELESPASGWKEALSSAQELIREDWDLPLVPYGSDPSLPFVDIWWPLRCRMAEQLRDQEYFYQSNFSASVADQMADALLERLCSLTDQVFWELFSTGRTPGVMLLSHLGESGDGCGPPMREHYQAFIRQHRHDGLSGVLSEFPVLKRLIGTVLVLWSSNSKEMLERINSDRAALEDSFGIPRSHFLVALQQGLSDPHRGGRAVAVLKFSVSPNGASKDLRVVYKPKDMGVDAAYQDLLADLNAQSDLSPLKCLTVHLSDDYGYMEFVPHRLCSDARELKQFYENAGRLTAVLHVLGCTDCHYENLIASADQLLLIDTETLLEADLSDHVQDSRTQKSIINAESELQQRFRSSVLRSGLMPHWMFMGVDKQAVDISALGIAPPASAERQSPGWLGLNSDGMMPGFSQQTISIPTSLPVGFGASNPLEQHLEEFCSGFSRQMQELERLKSRWLASGSVLEAFSGMPRRIVLRATRVYFAIQRQQLEPAALRSPFAQAIKLEQLARSFLLAESRPLHWPVLAAEQLQMQCLDIPFFTHAIDGDALHLDADGTLLPNFIQTSGLQAARQRLQHLNEEECAFQIELIRGACRARKQRTQSSGVAEFEDNSLALEPDGTCAGLEAAEAIARQLLNLAIRDPQGQVEWLGMDLGSDGESFSFGPVGLSLYGGAIGPACLLNELSKLSPKLLNAETVTESILKPLEALIGEDQKDARYRWWRDQPLGLSGCGGILLGLLALGNENSFDELLSSLLPRFLEADQQLDLIGGCCGLIGPLLQRGTDTAIAMAIQAGDQLLARQHEEGGWGMSSRHPALLGFSHGTAGMAAALARLHTICGEARFRDSAAAALAYERSCFKPEQGNWPDFRSGNNDLFMATWCHGAPGIALGRACLWGTDLWDESCSEEIGIALATTASWPRTNSDHLCCGSLGLMMILDQIALGPWPLIANQRDEALIKANLYRKQALDRCTNQRVKLRCFGTQEGDLMLPGFFTGLSGMGLALIETPTTQAMVMNLLSGGLLVP